VEPEVPVEQCEEVMVVSLGSIVRVKSERTASRIASSSNRFSFSCSPADIGKGWGICRGTSN
jgi:hypothetical protein